jgi:hypothetical protein
VGFSHPYLRVIDKSIIGIFYFLKVPNVTDTKVEPIPDLWIVKITLDYFIVLDLVVSFVPKVMELDWNLHHHLHYWGR